VTALPAGRVALLASGENGFIESPSALVFVWRLPREHAGRCGRDRIETPEHGAWRVVSLSLFLLGTYAARPCRLRRFRARFASRHGGPRRRPNTAAAARPP
jgi:hypothetical protein